MRPVERGESIILKDYSDALTPLRERLGVYCSYCEDDINPAEIEHIHPKSKDPSRRNDWANLLLACKSCNTIKGADEPEDAYFPDAHNTALVFVYENAASPKPSPRLTDSQRARALRSISLTGLDRRPGHPRYSMKDFR